MNQTQAEQLRKVPLDAPTLARFHAALPVILAYREQRVSPGHRTWGLEALGYGLLTLAGLYWWQWSPMLVFVHLLVTQWIGLLAEVLVLRRLGRRGITRLLSADQVHRFIFAVIDAQRRQRAQDPNAVAMILASALPDSVDKSDTAKNASPQSFANLLVFFGLLSGGILLTALFYAEGSLLAELSAQPLALALFGGFSLLQLGTQFRSKLAPPVPGTSWNVEFNPGLRLFGVVLLALLAPAVLQTPEEVRDWAMGIYACIAGWGAVTLYSLRGFQIQTQNLRAWLASRSD